MQWRRKHVIVPGAIVLAAGLALLAWSLSGPSKAEATERLRQSLTGCLESHRVEPAEIRRLVRAGADVHAQGEGGVTALHFACFIGDEVLAREIADRGADVTRATTDDGSTPLMLAAVVPGRHQLIGWLLEQGADPNARRKNGGTALMHAALNGDSPSAVLLLRSGADVRLRLDRGETAMTLAETCANKQRGEEVLNILRDAAGKL